MEDWYWAAARDEPALNRFVIANGQPRLWQRIRTEIDANDKCAWSSVHKGKQTAGIEDILELMLTVVPCHAVSYNRFALEAAKIPVFARFLRNAPNDLCNYVSNPAHPDHTAQPEPYSSEATRRLGLAVSSTLGIEADWFEY